MNPIFPSSYHPLLCSFFCNKISSKTCPLMISTSFSPSIPWSHQGLRPYQSPRNPSWHRLLDLTRPLIKEQDLDFPSTEHSLGWEAEWVAGDALRILWNRAHVSLTSNAIQWHSWKKQRPNSKAQLTVLTISFKKHIISGCCWILRATTKGAIRNKHAYQHSSVTPPTMRFRTLKGKKWVLKNEC